MAPEKVMAPAPVTTAKACGPLTVPPNVMVLLLLEVTVQSPLPFTITALAPGNVKTLVPVTLISFPI